MRYIRWSRQPCVHILIRVTAINDLVRAGLLDEQQRVPRPQVYRALPFRPLVRATARNTDLGFADGGARQANGRPFAPPPACTARVFSDSYSFKPRVLAGTAEDQPSQAVYLIRLPKYGPGRRLRRCPLS